MPLAERIARGFVRRKHLDPDEYVAEAYYILTICALRLENPSVAATIKLSAAEVNDEEHKTRWIRLRINKGLIDYSRQRKIMCVTEVLGPNWESDFAELIAVKTVDTSLRFLMDNIVDHESEIGILVLKATGLDGKKIAETLDIDVLRVRRVLNKIEWRLTSSCKRKVVEDTDE